MDVGSKLLGRLESTSQRDLYFFALYRLLEAGMLAALLFSPIAAGANLELRAPHLIQYASLFYSLFALVMLGLSLNAGRHLQAIAAVGVGVDVAIALAAAWAMPDAVSAAEMLLLFNVAIAAVLLNLRTSMAVVVLATVAIVGEYLFEVFVLHQGNERPLAEVAMFAIGFLAVGYLAGRVGARARSHERLAEQRGAEVASLAEINELIIRRMRTGVLVVDGGYRIRLANEAAALLFGSSIITGGDGAHLPKVSPELARRLQLWRNGWSGEEAPLQLAAEQAEVQPRFARLLADSELSLVFLDDASVVSRRAESMTLAALGRFSASLAHEIRNPLAAINYAVQLLEESRDINTADHRLLQIIHQQCQRTNGIVESVLGLARRERASPEHLDLVPYVRRFIDEHKLGRSLETDTLEIVAPDTGVQALADPGHLQQALTILVQNALNYGRQPGQPAQVKLRVAQAEQRATIDVLDRGPGIPETTAEKLFRPFFTTSEHGTGLGLYIARELCRANQATLDYLPMPGGGSCFRISLPRPHALLTD